MAGVGAVRAFAGGQRAARVSQPGELPGHDRNRHVLGTHGECVRGHGRGRRHGRRRPAASANRAMARGPRLVRIHLPRLASDRDARCHRDTRRPAVSHTDRLAARARLRRGLLRLSGAVGGTVGRGDRLARLRAPAPAGAARAGEGEPDPRPPLGVLARADLVQRAMVDTQPSEHGGLRALDRGRDVHLHLGFQPHQRQRPDRDPAAWDHGCLPQCIPAAASARRGRHHALRRAVDVLGIGAGLRRLCPVARHDHARPSRL